MRFSYFRHQKPNPISNEIGLSFDVFSEMHDYLRSKYCTDISHQDFYTRAHHLFEVLVDILEGQSPRDEVKPKGSQKYSQHYDNLLGTKRLTALDVENYILAVAKAAHSNENDDRTRAFYQRLLGRIMLPKLLLGARLSDEIFQKIVQEIPQEMLFEEQMLSEQRYKNSMLNSSLFLLLSASPCPTIIDRYCFIVSKYQSASDEVAIKFYQSSASFLRNIQNLAELPKTIIKQQQWLFYKRCYYLFEILIGEKPRQY